MEHTAHEIPIAPSAVTADSLSVQPSQPSRITQSAATATSTVSARNILRCAKANRRANSRVRTNGIDAASAQAIAAKSRFSPNADSARAAAHNAIAATVESTQLSSSELNANSAGVPNGRYSWMA